MQVFEFPCCCTAKVVGDFGGTDLSEGTAINIHKDTIKNYLLEIIEKNSSCAMITAITNSDQTAAIEALEELGFESSEWCTKPQHPETDVKLWWYAIY